MSRTQKVLLAIEAIAHLSEDAETIWGVCWWHWQSRKQSAYSCVKGSKNTIIKLSLKFAMLGRIAEWFKNDEGITIYAQIAGVAMANAVNFTFLYTPYYTSELLSGNAYLALVA